MGYRRYITCTCSQVRPQFSAGRPVDRVGMPWPTRPRNFHLKSGGGYKNSTGGAHCARRRSEFSVQNAESGACSALFGNKNRQ